MKLNMKYVIFGCVLLLVILLTMGASCGAMPYSASTRSYAFIEGFDVEQLKREFDSNLTYFLKTMNSKTSSIDNEFIKDEILMIGTIRKQKKYDVQMVKEQLKKAADKFGNDSNTHKAIKEFIDEKLQPIIDSANATEHDAMLVTAETVTDTKTGTDTKMETNTKMETDTKTPVVQGFTTMTDTLYTIDKFSSAVGNQSCAKTASGLSNSTGALCLSEEQLYLLQSRGGNSTGRDSQIA
jgi:hypothetical protein